MTSSLFPLFTHEWTNHRRLMTCAGDPTSFPYSRKTTLTCPKRHADERTIRKCKLDNQIEARGDLSSTTELDNIVLEVTPSKTLGVSNLKSGHFSLIDNARKTPRETHHMKYYCSPITLAVLCSHCLHCVLLRARF